MLRTTPYQVQFFELIYQLIYELISLNSRKLHFLRHTSIRHRHSYNKLDGSDYSFKIIVIGDSDVGKSSLTLRLTDDIFYADHAATIGIDFRVHSLTIQGRSVRLHVWDTAGQERFQNVTASFYRGANGILLCFDVTKRYSFQSLEKWMERVRLQAVPTAPLVLVGCKADDIVVRREVTSDEAVEWSAARGIPYIETSARSNIGVELAFETVTKSMIALLDTHPMHRRTVHHPVLQPPFMISSAHVARNQEKESKSCC